MKHLKQTELPIIVTAVVFTTIIFHCSYILGQQPVGLTEAIAPVDLPELPPASNIVAFPFELTPELAQRAGQSPRLRSSAAQLQALISALKQNYATNQPLLRLYLYNKALRDAYNRSSIEQVISQQIGPTNNVALTNNETYLRIKTNRTLYDQLGLVLTPIIIHDLLNDPFFASVLMRGIQWESERQIPASNSVLYCADTSLALPKAAINATDLSGPDLLIYVQQANSVRYELAVKMVQQLLERQSVSQEFIRAIKMRREVGIVLDMLSHNLEAKENVHLLIKEGKARRLAHRISDELAASARSQGDAQ